MFRIARGMRLGQRGEKRQAAGSDGQIRDAPDDDGQARSPAVQVGMRAAAPGCRDGAGRRRSRDGIGLDDLAGVHDRDAVGDLVDDSEVVGDQDHAHPELVAQAGEQVEDLGLDRDVERGRRLVGDQQLGFSRSAVAIITRWRIPPENWCG